MEHAAAQATGCFVNTTHAWWVAGFWIVGVLAYGLWRSLGDAKQDTIRPSGPTG